MQLQVGGCVGALFFFYYFTVCHRGRDRKKIFTPFSMFLLIIIDAHLSVAACVLDCRFVKQRSKEEEKFFFFAEMMMIEVGKGG